jgi:hypothetical protein
VCNASWVRAVYGDAERREFLRHDRCSPLFQTLHYLHHSGMFLSTLLCALVGLCLGWYQLQASPYLQRGGAAEQMASDKQP